MLDYKFAHNKKSDTTIWNYYLPSSDNEGWTNSKTKAPMDFNSPTTYAEQYLLKSRNINLCLELFPFQYLKEGIRNMRMRVLRDVLMFLIGMVCRSEKCAILKRLSDWHCANFIISKPHKHAKWEVQMHKNLRRDQ